MRPSAQSAPIRSRSVAARTRTWDRNSATESSGRAGAGETITTVGFDDAAVGAECTDPLEERGGADANLGSQFGDGIGWSALARMAVMRSSSELGADRTRSPRAPRSRE